MRKSSAAFLSTVALLGGILLIGRVAVPGNPVLPDLAVSPRFIGLPGPFEVGMNIPNGVRPTISNSGQAACSGYSVAVVLSTSPAISPQAGPHAPIATGRVIAQRDISKPLLPGNSEVVPIDPVRIPNDITWGDYFITVIVDPANKVNESNETNNSAQASLHVMVFTMIEQWYGGTDVLIHFDGQGFGSWKSSFVARVGPYVIPTTDNWWSNNDVKVFPPPGLIPLGQIYDVGLFDGDKAICASQKKKWCIFLVSVTPAAGPPGTVVSIVCCNCETQGTKKLVLHKDGKTFYEVPVISWANGLLRGKIPSMPAGAYWFGVTDGGNLITSAMNVPFTVN